MAGNPIPGHMSVSTGSLIRCKDSYQVHLSLIQADMSFLPSFSKFPLPMAAMLLDVVLPICYTQGGMFQGDWRIPFIFFQTVTN